MQSQDIMHRIQPQSRGIKERKKEGEWSIGFINQNPDYDGFSCKKSRSWEPEVGELAPECHKIRF